jgi:peptidoglycan hydrolase-like protein with peptidoglycan-binding domain
MDIRIAGIVVGLMMMVGVPVSAQQPAAPKADVPANAHHSPARKPAAHKSQLAAPAAASQPVGDQAGTAVRRKGKPAAKGIVASEIPPALTAIPQGQRLAIQSDLGWLGDFDATDTKNVNERTVGAIKTFQQRHGGKATGVLSDEELGALAAAVKTPEAAVGWRVIDDGATGVRLGLPTKLVPQSGATRTGSRWSSAHGQIQVETFRLHEAALPALFDDEKRTPRTRRVEYSDLRPDSFVISGMQGLKKFLVRAAARGTELRGVTILYDQATEGTMAPVALAMSNGFEGFPDPSSALPPGSKRRVEYATAIVASSRGYLLTSKQAVEDCQSITVPGFGHAERMAEDKSSDLALLRLYGPRNLTAAALAGHSGSGGDLTLVGIAAPQGESDDGAVTSMRAHLNGLIIEPAPKLGFSGAAAIDAQGVFAGVIELMPPLVAGIDSVIPEAALVPAEAARAFLGRQGIALNNGRASINQSIVRVICVRK